MNIQWDPYSWGTADPPLTATRGFSFVCVIEWWRQVEIYTAVSAIWGAQFSGCCEMQWSAWAGPALRHSDVPWECQMWGHPSTPGSVQPPLKSLSDAYLTLHARLSKKERTHALTHTCIHTRTHTHTNAGIIISVISLNFPLEMYDQEMGAQRRDF